MKNQIMLITYADSLGQNLTELHELLDGPLKGTVGGVHILPFFPSSADRGFAPIRYDVVDEKFGNFSDVQSIGREYALMFDFMVNHISRQSVYFQHFLQHGDNSPYRDFFIRYQTFLAGRRAHTEQVDKIYKRKPRAALYRSAACGRHR